MAYFYGRLFAANPELRALFPLAMDRQRDRFFRALARLVWSLDCPEELTAFVRQLGRDHRRFGVTARHYPEFMAALLATVREFAGPAWSDDVAAAWQAALDMVTRTMLDGRERRRQARAVLVAGRGHRAPAPGAMTWPCSPSGRTRRCATCPASTSACSRPAWPREWRNYSIANAPRDDGTITLHVRAVPGGLVSTALVQHTVPGDTLLLGPASGSDDAAGSEPARDLLCVAGGTGLAPVKAIAEQAAAAGGPAVTLLFGARTEAGLYDLRALRRLAAPAVARAGHGGLGRPGLRRRAGAAAGRACADRDEWNDREVVVCGPAGWSGGPRPCWPNSASPPSACTTTSPSRPATPRRCDPAVSASGA